MSAPRHQATRSLRNPYFTWHALPRFQNRFSLPRDIRRLAGGGTGGEPPADRPAGGVAAGPTVSNARPRPSCGPPGASNIFQPRLNRIPVSADGSPPSDRRHYRRNYRVTAGHFSQRFPSLCPSLIRTAYGERSNNFNRAVGQVIRQPRPIALAN